MDKLQNNFSISKNEYERLDDTTGDRSCDVKGCDNENIKHTAQKRYISQGIYGMAICENHTIEN